MTCKVLRSYYSDKTLSCFAFSISVNTQACQIALITTLKKEGSILRWNFFPLNNLTSSLFFLPPTTWAPQTLSSPTKNLAPVLLLLISGFGSICCPHCTSRQQLFLIRLPPRTALATSRELLRLLCSHRALIVRQSRLLSVTTIQQGSTLSFPTRPRLTDQPIMGIHAQPLCPSLSFIVDDTSSLFTKHGPFIYSQLISLNPHLSS